VLDKTISNLVLFNSEKYTNSLILQGSYKKNINCLQCLHYYVTYIISYPLRDYTSVADVLNLSSLTGLRHTVDIRFIEMFLDGNCDSSGIVSLICFNF